MVVIRHEFGPFSEGILLRTSQLEFCHTASCFGGGVVVKDDVRLPAAGRDGEQSEDSFRPENLVHAIFKDPSGRNGCDWGSQEQIV